MTKLTGRDALAFARLTGRTLNVYANEVEIDGRVDVPLADAEEIARQDVSLLWCEVETLTDSELTTAQAWAGTAGDEKMIETCRRAMSGDRGALDTATRIVRMAAAEMAADAR